MKKCTYCGMESPDDLAVCPVDAQPLVEFVPVPPIVEKPRMDQNPGPNPIPKFIGLVFATVFVAWGIQRYSAHELVRLNSLSLDFYIQQQRELHRHSYLFHFVTWLVLGGFYLGTVEFIAFVMRRLT